MLSYHRSSSVKIAFKLQPTELLKKLFKKKVLLNQFLDNYMALNSYNTHLN